MNPLHRLPPSSTDTINLSETISSDVAHLFSDLMGFVFAIAAGQMASMPGSRNYVSPHFAGSCFAG
jgi:hypothetical protein